MTRFVDENKNARDGMNAAPFLKRVLLSAADAYEQLELAAPYAVASAISRTPSRPSARCIRSLETTACTIPESTKPKTRLQPTSHTMPAATTRACQSAKNIEEPFCAKRAAP